MRSRASTYGHLLHLSLIAALVVPPGLARRAGADEGPLATPGIIQSRHDPRSVTPDASEVDASMFRGNASYAIPIELPPGTGGVQPRISLIYSSENRRGNAGKGWSLELPKIHRSTRYGSDQAYELTFSEAAAKRLFVYDGEPLVPTEETATDPYGCVATRFRRAVDRFERILHCLSDDYWTVTQRDGTYATFGRNADGQQSRLRRPGPDTVNATMEWHLDEVANPRGLLWQASYYPYSPTSFAAPRLRSIRYTLRREGAGPPTALGGRQVDFQWERRPDLRAEYVHYAYGFQLAQLHRLAAIEVRLLEDLVRRYELSYDAKPATPDVEDFSPDSGRSMLRGVVLQGAHGETMPATTFTYRYNVDPDNPTNNAFSRRALGWDTEQIGHQEADDFAAVALEELYDMNGDGLLDLVSTDRQSWWVQWGTEAGLSATPTLWEGVPWAADLYYASRCNQAEDTTASTGLQAALQCLATLDFLTQERTKLIDMNGDARPDLLTALPGTPPRFNRNLGHGFAPGVEWGNGREDLITRHQGKVWASGSGGTTLCDFSFEALFFSFHVYPDGSFGWEFDIDDIVDFLADDALTVDLFVEGHCAPANVPSLVEYTIHETIVDLNGDGCPDRLTTDWFSQSATAWAWYRNALCDRDGTEGFGDLRPWMAPSSGVWAFSTVPYLNRVEKTLQSDDFYVHRNMTRLVDLNGDGLVDLTFHDDRARLTVVLMGTGRGFALEDDHSATTYGRDLLLIFSDSTTLYEDQVPFAVNPDLDTRYFGGETLGLHDVNGDRLLDIIGRGALFDGYWTVYLNTGTGFDRSAVLFPTPVATSPSARLPMPDPPIQGEWTRHRRSQSAGQPAHEWTETDTAWRFVDYTGSGTPDVLNPPYLYVSPFPHAPDLLAKIDNGRGLTTELSYTTHRLQEGVDGNQTPPAGDLPAPIDVLAMQRTCSVDGSDGSPGGGTCYDTRYRYYDGYYERRDGREKKFVGFGRVDVEQSDSAEGTSATFTRYTIATGDPDRNIVEPSTRLFVNDGDGLEGRVVLVERGPSGSSIQQRIWTHWSVHDTAGDGQGAWAPYVTLRRKIDILGGARRVSQERFLYSTGVGFDPYGRVLVEYDDGEITTTSGGTFDLDAGDGSTRTQIVYAENASRHVVSRPARRVVRDAITDDLLREDTFRYDRISALGAVEVGDLTSHRRSVMYPGEDTVWAVTTYDRDGGDDNPCPPVGNITRVEDPEGAVTDYAYHPGSCAYVETETTLVGGQPHTIRHEWDERFGVETKTIDPNGRAVRTVFDGFGRPKQVRGTPPDDPAGAEILLEAFEYQDHAIPNRVSHQEIADANLSTTTEGLSFLDGFGRQIQSKVLRERSDCAPGGCDTLRYSTINRHYDRAGRLLRETLPYETADPGFSPIDFRSNASRPAPTRTALYDWAGRETSRWLRPGNGGSVYLYQTSHGLWSSTTRHNNPAITGGKEIRYDAHGRLLEVLELDGDTPRGKVTYVYDPLGNVTHQYFTNLETGEAEPGTIMTYDSRGLMRTRVDPNLNNCDDPAACPTELSYDLNGRLVSTVDAKGQEVEYVLDELGRVTYTDYCPGVRICPFGYDVVRTYDAPGALGYLSQVDPAGGIANEVTYDHDNWGRVIGETRTIHDRTAATMTEYDYLGRVTKLTYPSGSGARVGDVAPPDQGRLLGDRGTVTNVELAALQTSGFHFRTGSQAAFVTHLCGYFTGSKPVKLWNRATGALLAQATVTNSVSLAAGQWECAELATPVHLAASSSFTVATVIGGNGGVQRSGFSYPFSPNALAEVEGSTFCLGSICRPTMAGSATMSVGQADVRLVSAVDGPEEARITYGLTGLVESIYWDGGDHGTGSPPSRWIVENVLYDPMGRAIRVDWGNGLKTVFDHSPVYQKVDYVQILAPYALVPSGELHRLTYDYGPDGNIGSVVSAGQGNFTESYYYDYADRLIGAAHVPDDPSPGWDIAYTYSANGNLRAQNDAISGRLDTYDYAVDLDESRIGGPHAVSLYNKTSRYGYDANGRMLLDGVNGSSYAYNVAGALRYVRQPVDGCDPSVSSLHRDGDQVTRLRTTSGGCARARNVYTFGPHYEVVVDDPGGPEETITHDRYINLNGVRIAHLRGSSLQFLHNDHLGTATLITDASGQVVDFRKYRPFGVEYDDTNGDTSGHRYGFTGAEELHDMCVLGVREYTPSSGRMTSPDPIIPDPLNPQSFNRYSYAYNNPIWYTDRSGYAPDDPGAATVGSVTISRADIMIGWVGSVAIASDVPGFDFEGVVNEPDWPGSGWVIDEAVDPATEAPAVIPPEVASGISTANSGEALVSGGLKLAETRQLRTIVPNATNVQVQNGVARVVTPAAKVASKLGTIAVPLSVATVVVMIDRGDYVGAGLSAAGMAVTVAGQLGWRAAGPVGIVWSGFTGWGTSINQSVDFWYGREGHIGKAIHERLYPEQYELLSPASRR